MRTRSSAGTLQVPSEGAGQVQMSPDPGQASNLMQNSADSCSRLEPAPSMQHKHASSAASASDGTISAHSNNPHSMYQADQAGCARAQPYIHNSMLRQTPWPTDDDQYQLDVRPPQQVAPVSLPDNIDITTPEPDDTSAMLLDASDNATASDTQTGSPTLCTSDDDPLVSETKTKPPQKCATVPSRPNCHSYQDEVLTNPGLDSFAHASHDANYLVQQIDQVSSRRAAFQKEANQLHCKVQQLEQQINVTRQQAATAEEMVQTADEEHQYLDQTLEQMLKSASVMLTVMQNVKRRKTSN